MKIVYYHNCVLILKIVLFIASKIRKFCCLNIYQIDRSLGNGKLVNISLYFYLNDDFIDPNPLPIVGKPENYY